MRTPEQVKWDFVQQWLDRTHRDLRAASILLGDDFEDYENVGFHAQQAAEKFIKACLVRHQIEFPKTHNIALLRQLIAQVDQALAERLASADVRKRFTVFDSTWQTSYHSQVRSRRTTRTLSKLLKHR